MSHIRIERSHNKPHEEARKLAERVAQEMADEFGFSSRWEGDVLHFDRSGVEGKLSVETDKVKISAKLSFLLLALKPKIESEIHKFLDENFG
ncbi:MAG: polyhydroxyalkanoic acid system family protein [Chitinivorax sp.]